MEYAGLRRRISDAEKGASKARKADRREEAAESLEALRPGDVIEVPAGKFAGWAVVVDPGWSAGGTRGPYVVTADRQARRLAMIDFPAPVEALGKVRIPKNFNGRNPQMRRDLASALRIAHPRPGTAAPGQAARPAATRRRTHADDEISRLRDELRAHPCHDCPDREDHARWAERYYKLDRDAQTLRRRVEQRTNTVARQFDRVCEVLTALGYLDGDTVTDRGRHLMRLYSEMDLVAAECLRRGSGTSSSPSELAAALSVLVFEARRPDDASLAAAAGRRGARGASARWCSSGGSLDALERDHRLDFLRAARPRLRLGRLPLGRGRRPRRRAAASATWRPATSCAG